MSDKIWKNWCVKHVMRTSWRKHNIRWSFERTVISHTLVQITFKRFKNISGVFSKLKYSLSSVPSIHRELLTKSSKNSGFRSLASLTDSTMFNLSPSFLIRSVSFSTTANTAQNDPFPLKYQTPRNEEGATVQYFQNITDFNCPRYQFARVFFRP